MRDVDAAATGPAMPFDIGNRKERGIAAIAAGGENFRRGMQIKKPPAEPAVKRTGDAHPLTAAFRAKLLLMHELAHAETGSSC
ncbi:hypothetical protein [Herbaspirillum chlorophenolicum]|uniref:hypothetical protein n=1 Tax=Herbaspirillum chlorophenolicum TaxID=211589 RepID=UPI0012E24BBE|nr:hypothetical protein [Herbaspirillum chlorophenolicum]